jgi:hypothetical protein
MGKESMYVSVYMSEYVSVAGGVVLELMPEMLQRASVMYICLSVVCLSVYNIGFCSHCVYTRHTTYTMYTVYERYHIFNTLYTQCRCKSGT